MHSIAEPSIPKATVVIETISVMCSSKWLEGAGLRLSVSSMLTGKTVERKQHREMGQATEKTRYHFGAKYSCVDCLEYSRRCYKWKWRVCFVVLFAPCFLEQTLRDSDTDCTGTDASAIHTKSRTEAI